MLKVSNNFFSKLENNGNPICKRWLLPSRQKKGTACMFYGCLTVIIFFVLATAGIYFGVHYFVSHVIDQYTMTEPIALQRWNRAKKPIN